MRTKLVAGNWKMNLDYDAAMSLVAEVCRGMSETEADVMIMPPSLYLRPASEFLLQHQSKVKLGAQDCSAHDQGAYTGELAADMLCSAGASCTLVGHSERRSYHREGDALLLAKCRAALNHGLDVVFCCGEGLEDRDAGREEAVIADQLNGVLAALNSQEIKRVTIAYEPVWAIGTGRTASPEQAQDMHRFIRSWLSNQFDEACASSLRILYGGSVKPGNAADLFAQPDVDGALVGGASLKAADFLSIVEAAK